VRFAEVNALSDEAFVARFGALYEHSPWVALGALGARPFEDVAGMLGVVSRVVREAGEARQLALVRAHPELGNRAGIDPALTEASASEQGSLGLDRLSAAEYERFRALNAAYRAKFGMPFVICVRRVGTKAAGKAVILEAMERRLGSVPEVELVEALAQIDAIAGFRLRDMVTG